MEMGKRMWKGGKQIWEEEEGGTRHMLFHLCSIEQNHWEDSGRCDRWPCVIIIFLTIKF